MEKDWTKEDQNADPDTRFKWFKTYYITKTDILAADEVQSTTNWASSAMEQKLTDLQATVLKLNYNNSVLMANQEDMTSAYKNGIVPTEITTGGGGGLVAPGSALACGQILDERLLTNASSNSSETTSGDTNKNVDTKKEQVAVTWWRQFKYYCPSCGVNLHHGAKKCPTQKQMKGYNKNVTWEKKESPRNKEY